MSKTTVTGSLSEEGKIVISEPGVTESCLFVFPGQSSEYGDEKTKSKAGSPVLEHGPDWLAHTC